MDSPIPAFVINLADAQDRRSRIMAMLSRYEELSADVVPAVDGRHVSADAFAGLVAAPRVLFRHCREHSLTGGETACALSHLRSLRRVVERDIPHALVLEDDVLLRDGFGRIVGSAAAFLHSLSGPAVVLLSARTKVYGPVRWRYNDGAIRSAFGGVGAYAYLVNRSGAARLLERTLPLVAPFDHWHCHVRNGIRLYSFLPHPASFMGKGDDSAIREQRTEKWRKEESWRREDGRFRWWMAQLLDGSRIRWSLLKHFRDGIETSKEWPDGIL